MTGQLLRSTTGAVVGTRDVIVVTGVDAAAYLQGQISQDVDSIELGDSAWSLILEPQGKLVARFRITRRADDFLLDLESGWSAVLVTRLERFRLRVDVAFEPVSWTMVSVRGPSLDDVVNDAAPISAGVEWAGVRGIDLVGPDLLPPPGIEVADQTALEVLRIEAGVPAQGSELVEGTIAAEAGIVDDAVSFTKGCYTGQELVARIDSRGSNTPRHLRGLVIDDGRVPEPGAPIVVDGDLVGTVTSAAHSAHLAAGVALGYVRRAVTPPSQAIVGDAPARIVELPIVGG